MHNDGSCSNAQSAEVERNADRPDKPIAFDEITSTQARCAVSEVIDSQHSCSKDMEDIAAINRTSNLGDGNLNERDSNILLADEATQHMDSRVVNNLNSRFNDECLNKEEVNELFTRVFGSTLDDVDAPEDQWDKWWKDLVTNQFAPKLMTPAGEVGKMVVRLFADELEKGNKEVDTPDSRLLVCMMIILQREKKKMTANGIKHKMAERVELWRDGKYSDLIRQALENEKQFRRSSYRSPPKDDEAALRYASSMFSKHMKLGDIGKAVRWGMGGDQNQTTVFQPQDVILTRKGEQRVADILAEKYPAPAPVYREAVEEIIECNEIETPLIFDVTPEEVERQASTLKGSAGPSGVDAVSFERMITAHGDESKAFREAFVERVHLLSRQPVPWAKVRAMRACRQVALGTRVGVRESDQTPIIKLRGLGAGEVMQRMMTRMVVSKTRDEFIESCGILNMCTGVRAGAEGIVHTYQQVVREVGLVGDHEDPEVILKMDATDAFNNISRSVALLHAGVMCPKSRCFMLNGYRGSALMVAKGNKGGLICRSVEGVIQGDPAASLLFAAGTIPLLKRLHTVLRPLPETRRSNGLGIGLQRSGQQIDDDDASEAVDETKFEFVLRFDGGADAVSGARGTGVNSKVPVGAGVVLYRGGVENRHRVYERAIYLPEATVNDGEFRGAIAGLEACVSLGIKRVLVQGDSQLVLDSLSGKATIAEPRLREHYDEATRLIRSLPPGSVVFEKITRDRNSRADALTHLARNTKGHLERFYLIVGNPLTNDCFYIRESKGPQSARLPLSEYARHERIMRPIRESIALGEHLDGAARAILGNGRVGQGGGGGEMGVEGRDRGGRASSSSSSNPSSSSSSIPSSSSSPASSSSASSSSSSSAIRPIPLSSAPPAGSHLHGGATDGNGNAQGGGRVGMVRGGNSLGLSAASSSRYERRTVQCAFADDLSAAGPVAKVLDWAELAVKLAPKYGIRFNPDKTGIMSCDPKRTAEVQKAVEARPRFADVEVTKGMEILGCYVGWWGDVSDFIEEKVAEWAGGLARLAKVGKGDPHGLYTAVTSSFLGMPTYVQRGMGGESGSYAPIERVMAESVIPNLVPQGRTGEGAREVYALPYRLGGLGLTNVTTTVQPNHDVAVKATMVLTEALLGKREWSAADHNENFSNATSEHKTAKLAELKEEQDRLQNVYVSRLPPPQKKATEHAMHKGTHYFLVSKPVEAHRTYLSPEQWDDALATRYGYNPRKVSPSCSQCHKENDLAHALTCRHGGNLHGRHNMLRDELAHVCRSAFGQAEFSVEVEPWVRRQAGGGLADLRADVGVRGLDQPGTMTMLDVRICHPAADSHIRLGTDTVLSNAEVEKTALYGDACRERGMLFKPFVVSTDGVRGAQAEVVIKRLGEALSHRWRMSNSKAVTWVRSRLAVALAKGCSACIRAPRVRYRGGGEQYNDARRGEAQGQGQGGRADGHFQQGTSSQGGGGGK